ncbi:tubulin-like doman-containing protein [Streptomyces muensis]|uniref:Tubulin-like doman-containing protein n=1 Tax=Streptomyces muensis TaxID=1077944 RepID=A0A9X1Q1R2_STRM4|nr:tubulin-like doman-containing protein [Streptomyces muensis]MCF1596971.1 tubulin-like doman-containing protein [Streptomyces muensis]
MDDSLARGMARLLAGTDTPSTDDIADALWVARVIGRSGSREEGPQEEPAHVDDFGADAGGETWADVGSGRGGRPGSGTSGSWLSRLLAQRNARRDRTRDASPIAAPPPAVPLHPVSAGMGGAMAPLAPGTENSGEASEGLGAVVRVQSEPALSESLSISQALRPLKRQVRAPGVQRLDEAATARATCESSVLMPAWLPHTERWLSVDLIVDMGPSMVIWRRLAAELRTLLEGHGAFRMVRTWSLDSGEAEPRLSPFRRRQGSGPKRTVPLEQLADPTGRRVLLLLTDGVGPLWHGGGLSEALCQWSRNRPVAVLQVLPRSMWHRTGLPPVPVLARPGPPGHATPQFRTETAVPGTPSQGRCRRFVPVLELDADWIAPWAQVVAGRAAGWTPMLAVPVGGSETDNAAAPDEEVEAPAGLDPAALVERFRSEASPSAFELAGYLAATPLVLPVMRLVQRTMMPRSKPAHLAEVFLSGLLTPADGGAAPDPGEDPDLRLYDFRPGVRDVLLDTLTRQESLRTLDVVGQISGRVAQRLGGSLDFRALVPTTDAEGTWRLPEGSLPFARVAASVLAGLGGEHRATATALAERITAGSDEPPRPDHKPRRAPRATPAPSRSSLAVHRPMLFVGLGGTGCLIGAELERRLRTGLCGADGTALTDVGLAPHQLPDHVQFVYADYSEKELQRLPQFVVDPSLRDAYARTSRVTHNLLPDFDSSPEVTRTLRLALHDEVADWLPPHVDEPRIAPLHAGAGQLPTIGRAALFATLRNGLAPVLEPLLQAIDGIARSASGLGSRRGDGCDVFVAFSVAGGTGAGIFLDYLHLINHAFRLRRFDRLRIHPLVVMPSAFPAAAGGGREAELNAAPALVDLSRLVDAQNAPEGSHELGDLDRQLGLGIRYPGTAPVRLPPGILPTAFLFSRTAGIRPADLSDSIVSLVTSLVGSQPDDGPSRGRGTAVDDDPTTFAERWINRGVRRSDRSPTGIGRMGLSTSLAATLTAPTEQLADLVAGRLLRTGVRDLVERSEARSWDRALPVIRQLFADSGLEELWERGQLPVPEPDPVPRGGRAIEHALGDRIGEMQRLLSDLRSQADRAAIAMADRFAPRPAVNELLRTVDPFLAERIVVGVPDSEDPIARRGFLGMLDQRAATPQRPPGVTAQPPRVPRIRGQLGGLAPARWADDDVQAALQEQDAWYLWRCRMLWHEAWKAQQTHWRPLADAVHTDVRRLVDAFHQHGAQEPRVSQQKALELYEDRTGITYLLPQQRTLNHMYEEVVTRLIRREGLREMDDEGALLLRLVDGDTWRTVHAQSRRDPDGAVARVKSLLQARITRVFAENGPHLEERPLLPSIAMLLAAAAGDADARDQVGKEALDVFGRKLTGLLPVGFTPEGTGLLRVLVSHPRVQPVEQVREYLGKALRLPSDAKNSVEYRGVESDSITVLLVRSEMSLTQVPEAREALRQWARAKDSEQAGDWLRWRQRLGYRDGWIVSDVEDRRVILHRLLCCMWNGQVDVVDGDSASPDRIRLRLFPERGPDVPGVRLRLGDFPGSVSSWAELLRSYERWTILDEEPTVEDYCRELMGARPLGLVRTGSDPHPLFVTLVEKVAPRQLELLRERRERGGERVEGWVRPLWEFWAETLPAALDTEFGDPRALQPTLRTLLEHLRGGTSAAPVTREDFSALRRMASDEDDWAPWDEGSPRDRWGAPWDDDAQ